MHFTSTEGMMKRSKHELQTSTLITSDNILTWERSICVKLADTLFKQAEAQGQGGGVIQQVEHEGVAWGLISRNLFTLQLHCLLQEVCWLRFIVSQQLVENFQHCLCHFPLRREGLAFTIDSIYYRK